MQIFELTFNFVSRGLGLYLPGFSSDVQTTSCQSRPCCCLQPRGSVKRSSTPAMSLKLIFLTTGKISAQKIVSARKKWLAVNFYMIHLPSVYMKPHKVWGQEKRTETWKPSTSICICGKGFFLVKSFTKAKQVKSNCRTSTCRNQARHLRNAVISLTSYCQWAWWPCWSWNADEHPPATLSNDWMYHV